MMFWLAVILAALARLRQGERAGRPDGGAVFVVVLLTIVIFVLAVAGVIGPYRG